MVSSKNNQMHSDASMITPEEKDGEIGPKYLMVERVFHLLQLLLVNECTRLEIFEHLASYYRVDEHVTGRVSSSQRADRMLERDIKLLREQGFEIRKVKAKGRPTRYSLVKGSGPAMPSLFSESEVDILALLYNLFTDPARSHKHTHTGTLVLPTTQSLLNLYAEDILTFLQKLARPLAMTNYSIMSNAPRSPLCIST